MGRAFMACLSPFHQRKCVFHVTNSETIALLASFTTEIKNLQLSLSKNSLTLQWCTQAMTLLKKLHSEFLLIILEKSKVPFTWINDLLNLYMNESLNIMELCNMLKSSSFKFNMYHLTVDATIKNLNNYQPEAFANMQSIVQTDNKRIQYGGLNYQEMQRDCSSLVYTIRVAMSLLSFILLSAFLYPTNNYRLEVDRICCNSFPIKSFKDSVNELATEFQKKYCKDGQRGEIGFYEYKEMENAIMQAKEKLKRGYREDEEIKRNKDVILQKSTALKTGLEKFESQVNQVFEEVLKGRNKLLHMIGKSNGI